MTVIRSILLATLIFWPATSWGQVFTEPQPGVLRGVGLQPEMQRGLVSPGPSVGPRNSGYRGRVPLRNDGSDSNYSPEASGLEATGAYDPRYQTLTDLNGPATEGYPPQNAPSNRGRPAKGGAPGNLPLHRAGAPTRNDPVNRAGRPVKPVLSTSVWGRSKSSSGSYFAMIGAVGSPAVYFQMSDRIPLLELVKLAGGVTDQASGGVRIVRQGRGGLQTYLVPNTTYEILNGDVVYIEARKAATRSGLQEFSQPLRLLNASSRDDASNGKKAVVPLATSSAPTQAYLVFVGLMNRPIVVPVPSNEATLTAAMMWLKQDPQSAVWPRVLTPIPLPQSRDEVDEATRLLPNGTVLVFDSTVVNHSVLPQFPPAIGEPPASIPENDPAHQQLPPVDARFRGPVPRFARSAHPESRTESMHPVARTPEFESVPPPPADVGPQRPRLKSPDAEDAPADVSIKKSDEVSFDETGRPVGRPAKGGGPILFSPRTENLERPQVNSPDKPRHSRPIPHSDSDITPTNSSQISNGGATTADFHEPPRVIPNGPAFNGPQNQGIAQNEPRLLHDPANPADDQDQQFQNEGQVINAADSRLASDGSAAPPLPSTRAVPWYSSTIGIVWLSSSVILLILVGVWGVSRFEVRLTRQGATGSLNDLMMNRLPVMTESVRPPLGLRLQGRPGGHAASSNSVPTPHVDPLRFRSNASNHRVPETPVTGKSPQTSTVPPELRVDPARPTRTISEQERNLRAEFHQARLDRQRQEAVDSGTVATTGSEVAASESLPAPHFAMRPKILVNVPRVHVAPSPGTQNPMNQPTPADDSAVLGRALTNRRNNP